MIISVCAGYLVLLSWELNVVESVVLTMAVSLSIDFCLHYAMGYKLCNAGDRKLRVHQSFKKVGTAVFMAASTSFVAGICVVPSTVLFFFQLGTFLMLDMIVSWLFSTFFFQSLCYARSWYNFNSKFDPISVADPGFPVAGTFWQKCMQKRKNWVQ